MQIPPSLPPHSPSFSSTPSAAQQIIKKLDSVVHNLVEMQQNAGHPEQEQKYATEAFKTIDSAMQIAKQLPSGQQSTVTQELGALIGKVAEYQEICSSALPGSDPTMPIDDVENIVKSLS